MKLAFLTLLPLAAAVPGTGHGAPKRSQGSFGVMSAHSGTDIHLLPMNAANSSFWLGGQPSTYCPGSVAQTGNCPPGNSTALSSATSLDVNVPGGQAIYVDRSGALRFTSPHSSYIPPGSSTGPFTYKAGNPFGHWVYSGQGASGFMACPKASGNGDKKYQVFAAMQNATVPSGNVRDCVGFDALAVKAGGDAPAAWEYI